MHVPSLVKIPWQLSYRPERKIWEETRGLMIWSSQFWNSSKIPFMSTLCASFRKIKDPSKTEHWAMLMTSKTEAFSAKAYNSKINGVIWPVFLLVQWFIQDNKLTVHLICKFQERRIKSEGVMMMTSIFPLSFGFHSNQVFYWIPKHSLCHQSPPEAYYRCEMTEISHQTYKI